MKAADIDKKLRSKFISHKYELSNSYVFNWESDFFSITNSGYCQEIEIKISLSDFRADFNKTDKHQVLECAFKGISKRLTKGDDVYKIRYEEQTSLVKDGKRVYDENWNTIQVGTGKFVEREIRTNNIEYHIKNRLNLEYQHTSCEIRIAPITKTPNKFWYCCPTGIIPVNEVPEYAGLYYINENMRMTVIKRAPFIHKEKQDLTKVLLDKFYWGLKNLKATTNAKQLQLL